MILDSSSELSKASAQIENKMENKSHVSALHNLVITCKHITVIMILNAVNRNNNCIKSKIKYKFSLKIK
jgi:hypothetical protein